MHVTYAHRSSPFPFATIAPAGPSTHHSSLRVNSLDHVLTSDYLIGCDRGPLHISGRPSQTLSWHVDPEKLTSVAKGGTIPGIRYGPAMIEKGRTLLSRLGVDGWFISMKILGVRP